MKTERYQWDIPLGLARETYIERPKSTMKHR